MDEFTIYFIGNILISAIVTAFTYGFGPITITLFWGKPIQKKKFKGFCIIYTIVVWFSWQMYRESSGNGVSIMPAILWGYVSYLIANGIMDKKYGGQNKLKKEKQDLNAEASKPEQQAALPEPVEVESEQPEEQPKKEPEIQRWYTCPKCGQLVKDGEECDCEVVKLALEEDRKKKEKQKQQKRQALKKSLPLYAVCAVLLVAVCVLGVYSYNLKIQLDEMTDWSNMISYRYEKQKDEMRELENKIKKFELENRNSFWQYIN